MDNIVYVTSYCPFCHMVINLLEDLGIEFEKIEVSDRNEIDRIKKEYNWKTVPIVVINGEFVGGFNETKKMADQGNLTKRSND